jgi:hypothetical protein
MDQVTDGKGNLLDALELPDSATKGHSGRTIPLHRALHAALTLLTHSHQPQAEDPIIRSSHSGPMTAASVVNWLISHNSHLSYPIIPRLAGTIVKFLPYL